MCSNYEQSNQKYRENGELMIRGINGINSCLCSITGWLRLSRFLIGLTGQFSSTIVINFFYQSGQMVEDLLLSMSCYFLGSPE